MIQYTDQQIAKHLQELFEKITLGINSADNILKKTREIKSAVESQVDKAERTQAEISGMATGTQEIAKEVKEWQSEIKTIHNDVIKTVSEITNRETIDNLRQELQSAGTKLGDFQIQIKQIEDSLPAFNKQLNQSLSGVQQLASQVEIDKQDVSRLTQQLQDSVNQVLQVKSDIENLGNVIYRLESIDAEVKSDRELLQKIKIEVESCSVAGENSVREMRGEIQRLQQQFDDSFRELGQRLQTQAKSQERFRHWLLGVTFGVAMLAVFLVMLR
jgi:chromosome segregation ATPase